MAACTYAARILIDLRLAVPEARVIAFSRGADPGTTEVSTRTAAFSQIAAALWESKCGAAGAYDDTNGLIGDQTARQWGVRYAKYLLMFAFQMDTSPGEEQGLLIELRSYQRQYRQELPPIRERLLTQAEQQELDDQEA